MVVKPAHTALLPPVISHGGGAFTVNTTSSIAFPHGGVAVLVVVKRSVTVPVPATLTVVVNEAGVLIVAFAVPVCATCDQSVVPKAETPVIVNVVGPAGAVRHWAAFGPALENG